MAPQFQALLGLWRHEISSHRSRAIRVGEPGLIVRQLGCLPPAGRAIIEKSK